MVQESCLLHSTSKNFPLTRGQTRRQTILRSFCFSKLACTSHFITFTSIIFILYSHSQREKTVVLARLVNKSLAKMTFHLSCFPSESGDKMKCWQSFDSLLSFVSDMAVFFQKLCLQKALLDRCTLVIVCTQPQALKTPTYTREMFNVLIRPEKVSMCVWQNSTASAWKQRRINGKHKITRFWYRRKKNDKKMSFYGEWILIKFCKVVSDVHKCK